MEWLARLVNTPKRPQLLIEVVYAVMKANAGAILSGLRFDVGHVIARSEDVEV